MDLLIVFFCDLFFYISKWNLATEPIIDSIIDLNVHSFMNHFWHD